MSCYIFQPSPASLMDRRKSFPRVNHRRYDSVGEDNSEIDWLVYNNNVSPQSATGVNELYASSKLQEFDLGHHQKLHQQQRRGSLPPHGVQALGQGHGGQLLGHLHQYRSNSSLSSNSGQSSRRQSFSSTTSTSCCTQSGNCCGKSASPHASSSPGSKKFCVSLLRARLLNMSQDEDPSKSKQDPIKSPGSLSDRQEEHDQEQDDVPAVDPNRRRRQSSVSVSADDTDVSHDDTEMYPCVGPFEKKRRIARAHRFSESTDTESVHALDSDNSNTPIPAPALPEPEPEQQQPMNLCMQDEEIALGLSLADVERMNLGGSSSGTDESRLAREDGHFSYTRRYAESLEPRARQVPGLHVSYTDPRWSQQLIEEEHQHHHHGTYILNQPRGFDSSPEACPHYPRDSPQQISHQPGGPYYVPIYRSHSHSHSPGEPQPGPSSAVPHYRLSPQPGPSSAFPHHRLSPQPGPSSAISQYRLSPQPGTSATFYGQGHSQGHAHCHPEQSTFQNPDFSTRRSPHASTSASAYQRSPGSGSPIARPTPTYYSPLMLPRHNYRKKFSPGANFAESQARVAHYLNMNMDPHQQRLSQQFVIGLDNSHSLASREEREREDAMNSLMSEFQALGQGEFRTAQSDPAHMAQLDQIGSNQLYNFEPQQFQPISRGEIRSILRPEFQPAQGPAPKKSSSKRTAAPAAAGEEAADETSEKDGKKTGKGTAKKPPAKRTHKCQDCGKSFSQLRNFRYHRSRHEGTDLFQCICPICFKTFNDKGYLSSHLKIHRNAKEYHCEYCEKSFNQRVAYNMHVRIHTGVKPHECQFCDKAFSRKMLLRQHTRTHTGERPYKCSLCGKAFADRSNMLLHQKLHSGTRPYACPQCDKTFSKNHHLKTHLNHHLGIKPYNCPNCNHPFSQSSNMKTHMKKCKAPGAPGAKSPTPGTSVNQNGNGTKKRGRKAKSATPPEAEAQPAEAEAEANANVMDASNAEDRPEEAEAVKSASESSPESTRARAMSMDSHLRRPSVIQATRIPETPEDLPEDATAHAQVLLSLATPVTLPSGAKDVGSRSAPAGTPSLEKSSGQKAALRKGTQSLQDLHRAPSIELFPSIRSHLSQNVQPEFLPPPNYMNTARRFSDYSAQISALRQRSLLEHQSLNRERLAYSMEHILQHSLNPMGPQSTHSRSHQQIGISNQMNHTNQSRYPLNVTPNQHFQQQMAYGSQHPVPPRQHSRPILRNLHNQIPYQQQLRMHQAGSAQGGGRMLPPNAQQGGITPQAFEAQLQKIEIDEFHGQISQILGMDGAKPAAAAAEGRERSQSFTHSPRRSHMSDVAENHQSYLMQPPQRPLNRNPGHSSTTGVSATGKGGILPHHVSLSSQSQATDADTPHRVRSYSESHTQLRQMRLLQHQQQQRLLQQQQHRPPPTDDIAKDAHGQGHTEPSIEDQTNTVPEINIADIKREVFDEDIIELEEQDKLDANACHEFEHEIKRLEACKLSPSHRDGANEI